LKQAASIISLPNSIGSKFFNILVLADSDLDAAFTQFREEFLNPENVKKSLTENNATMLFNYSDLSFYFSNPTTSVKREFKAKFNDAARDPEFEANIKVCVARLKGKDDLLKQFSFMLVYCNRDPVKYGIFPRHVL
jgi:hypothetical protein